MKFLGLFAALLMLSSLTFASGNFRINNADIDKLFDKATEISFIGEIQSLNSVFCINNGSKSEVDNKIILAMILQFIPIIDFFGVHRYVLGTRQDMWFSYAITCGGIFGIVPIVDWCVLLIIGLVEGQGDQYLNNDKFFMWAN